jgi:hypothetical protein
MKHAYLEGWAPYNPEYLLTVAKRTEGVALTMLQSARAGGCHGLKVNSWGCCRLPV